MNDKVPATFEALDPRFDGIGGDAHLQQLYTGCRWAEGPVYFAAGRYLLVQVTSPARQLRPVDPMPFVVGIAQAARG